MRYVDKPHLRSKGGVWSVAQIQRIHGSWAWVIGYGDGVCKAWEDWKAQT